MTIAESQGLTVAGLTADLAKLPSDSLVLVRTGGTEYLHVITYVDTEDVEDQLDLEDDMVVLAKGEYPVLTAVETPYLVEEVAAELVVDLAELEDQ